MAGKRLTKKQKLEAITGSGGLLACIAERANVNRSTVRAWRDADPEIAQAITNERESVSDAAEKNVVDAIRAGDLHCSRWWLATVGRDRGFSQRQEIEARVTSNEPTRVMIYLPDNGRDAVDHENDSQIQITTPEG